MKRGENFRNGISEKNDLKKNKGKLKKLLNRYTIIGLVVGFFIGAMFMAGGSTDAEDSYNKQLSSLKNEISDKDEKIKDYKSEINNLNEKIKEAEPWFEMKEEERKAEEEKIQKQKEAEEKAKREAEEKKEAEEKAAQEKKEKQGYNTGITYKQLARKPDDYMLEKVKFKGKVIQVMENDNTVQIRLAVNGDYDNILLCEYDSSIVDSRVLEDDYITIYGTSSGLITYTSTLGANITIPGVLVDKIDM